MGQYPDDILRPLGSSRAEVTGEVIVALTESLSGISVVKGYRAEERKRLYFVMELNGWCKLISGLSAR